MIHVSIKLDDDCEIGVVRIEKIETHPNQTADYVVEFGVDNARGERRFLRKKVEAFPRTTYNVLGLLALALQSLDPEELRLAAGTQASDLAWRQRGTRLEIPR